MPTAEGSTHDQRSSPATDRYDDWKDCRPQRPEDGCDPSSTIDDLKCRDKGVAAQATYTRRTQPDARAGAEDDYDTARKAYREKRHEAALAVQDMKHQVKHLIERIRCLIEQDRVVRCLDDAFERGLRAARLLRGTGAAAASRTFEYDCRPADEKGYRKLRAPDRAVPGRGRRRRRRASRCWSGSRPRSTSGSPTRRPTSTTINAALAEDAGQGRPQDACTPRRSVARRKLARIWNGFADTTAFVDCLCQALTIVVERCRGGLACSPARRPSGRASGSRDQTWCDDADRRTRWTRSSRSTTGSAAREKPCGADRARGARGRSLRGRRLRRARARTTTGRSRRREPDQSA